MLSARVIRTHPATVEIREPRGRALVRLAIAVLCIGAFAAFALAGADPGAAGLAAIVALALSPYLVDGVRVALAPRSHRFDGERRILASRGRAPVRFDDIRGFEVAAVNLGCEECALRARLADGTTLELALGDRFASVMRLAGELGALVGARVRGRG